MGQITIPPKVKLIAGLLFNDKIKYEDVINILERNFGGIDCKSEIINFNFTDYYNKEMGVVIFRQYLAFKNLIDAVELADIKILTNKIEEEFSIDNKRNVNIDPGYIELGKLVLASTKNYTHRIYIGKGIFAEPTLQYYKKTYTKWPFSYPDYSNEKSVEFFNYVRSIYKQQI